MKFLLTIILSFLNTCIYAQEAAKFRVTYSCAAEAFVGKKETYRWILDVGNESAVFYDNNNRRYNEELDSLKNAADGGDLLEKMLRARKKYAARNSLQILIGKPERDMYTYVSSIGVSSLRYEEPLPEIGWQLEDSTKNICGYDCNMAVGRVYGRIWTVWYATEIPVAYGPYILGGLPGLIMSASDNDGVFNFEAIGIETAPDNTAVGLAGIHETQKCTRKKFLSLRKESSELSLMERAERTRRQLGLDNKNMTVKVVNADGKETAGDEMVPKRNYLDKE